MVWKSDNQGDKEETLTQTSRRGRDGQLGKEDLRQGGVAGGLARQQIAGWAVPHSSADKPGGTTGE